MEMTPTTKQAQVLDLLTARDGRRTSDFVAAGISHQVLAGLERRGYVESRYNGLTRATYWFRTKLAEATWI